MTVARRPRKGQRLLALGRSDIPAPVRAENGAPGTMSSDESAKGMTLPMTDEELRVLEELLPKRESFPWRSYIEGRDFARKPGVIAIKVGPESSKVVEFVGLSAEDQDFIAAARRDLPRLLTEVRRLRTVLKAFRSISEV